MLFFDSKLKQVYLTKMLCTRVLSKVTISARQYDPLLFARSFNFNTREDRNDDRFAACDTIPQAFSFHDQKTGRPGNKAMLVASAQNTPFYTSNLYQREARKIIKKIILHR